MARIEGSTIYLSSGREIYANQGIVGLSPELALSGGYDNGILIQNGGYLDDEALTPEEAVELADHMIEQWNKFKTKVRRQADQK